MGVLLFLMMCAAPCVSKCIWQVGHQSGSKSQTCMTRSKQQAVGLKHKTRHRSGKRRQKQYRFKLNPMFCIVIIV